MSDHVTRESLALTLAQHISQSEGKKLYESDRKYVLTLLRDVLLVLDGKGIGLTSVAPEKE